MEGVLATQDQIADAMQSLYSNFKKDGADRKTAAYIKKRLETLDSYWQEYHNNHLKLREVCDDDHPYFVQKRYDQVLDFYNRTRNIIQSVMATERPTTPVLKPSVLNPLPSTSSSILEDRGNNSKHDEMLRKQGSNFRAFLRTVANINLQSLNEKWELEDALKTLNTRWNVIDSLHWDLDSELEGSNLAYEQEYSKHEQTFTEIKKAINMKMWSSVHREKSTPKLDIPVFNGNYNQWVPFKDLFTESIHNNRSLSAAQKMQFLKSKVRGESERLIQHLSISTDNYSACWEILNNRYNNLKLIFTSHMNILLGLPTVQQASVTSIKKIHDVTLECLNAIKNLGVDISTWDPMIVHILCQKLDNETHHDYIQSLTHPRDLPKLQEFLDFLELTFTSMETSRKKQESFTPYKQFNQHQQRTFKTNYNKQAYSTNRNSTNSSPATQHGNNKTFPTKYKCPLCNNGHGLYFCPEFLDLTPQGKRKTVLQLNVCQNCLFSHNGKPCISDKKCRECSGPHNTILHDSFATHSSKNMNQVTSKFNASTTGSQQHSQQMQLSNNNSNVTQTNNMMEILLATAVLKIRAADGSYKTMRALIDQGSQVSIISENAAQRLALPRRNCKGSIFGVGIKPNSCKGAIDLECLSMDNSYHFDTTAFIMQSLVNQLPTSTFNKPSWNFLNNIQLADPDFNISRPIDILLGADIYSNIILTGICREENQSAPIAQQTRLGWILCGSARTYQCNVILNNMEQIERFWETEEITEEPNMSEEDLKCIQFYQNTTTRCSDGRYEVRIPMKPGYEQQLGQSRNKAVAQFLQLERKFHNNYNYAQKYKTFISEYLSLGHLKPVDTVKHHDYYLPHHGVERAESTTTALRVVFNGSGKTSTGSSLNDLMYAGPNLQQDLQGLLLRWRQYEVAFTADIEKMFRQVKVKDEDQHLQKIIWRESPRSALTEYQLTTVTYGTKAAPFLAMMTLKQLAKDERTNYSNSQAIKVLEECFYTDDAMVGTHSLASAKQLQQDLTRLLKSGGFNLRKWNSNKSELLLNIDQEQCNMNSFDFTYAYSTKTLGLRWNTQQDVCTFQSKYNTSTGKVTKRTLLSEISQLFDPLGWLSPVTIKFKFLFQRAWQMNLQWDDELPNEIKIEWDHMKSDIKTIEQIHVSRWLETREKQAIELHGYCDSSEKALSCAVYTKIIHDNKPKINLLVAKTRLVPRKKVLTIPRLELSGAVLLSRLIKKVKHCFSGYENITIYGWCDSTAVLGWLNGDPSRWKPFVANRVKQVTEVMPSNCWRYVKSDENPADCASRGLTAEQLKQHQLWWQGPSWLMTLKLEQDKMPTYTTKEEMKHACIVTKQEENINIFEQLIQKQSSFTRLIRILAWVLRFKLNKLALSQSYLTLSELKIARNKLIRFIQSTEFQDEINNIKQQKQVSKKSCLSKLNPFLDEHEILRVDGRLENAVINKNMKHPIILPNNKRFTELLILDAHKVVFHGGARVTAAFIRQTYWIVGGNRTIKKLLRTCITCRRHSPNIQPQIMGDLPPARCNPSRPFYHTGVDYTGYVDIKAYKGRNIRTTKGYVAVFVCMATKAVHLELVTDLTTSSFLAALHRMAARRGAPRHIYCDNGTNFIGANHALERTFQQHQQKSTDPEYMSEITKMGIEFHFNAPRWASSGGIWEACCKSLKYHIKRVIGEQKLTFEEFTTILSQLEACLNTRPLSALTEDIEDLNFLSPAHFLYGTADVTVLRTEHDARTRWQLTEKIMGDIWKRWKSEYLTQITVRNKWTKSKPNIEVGTLVTIQDDNLPPGKWSMGRVITLHPGKDGFVRVVTLKTKNGVLKRPVCKLSILPLQETISEDTKQKENSKKFTIQSSLLSFATTLLLFLSIIMPTYGADNIHPLSRNQTIYFDTISNVQFIRDEWKLIVYYDMQPFWEGTEALHKYVKHLEQICVKIKGEAHCNALLLQLRHSLNELEYYSGSLLEKQTKHDRYKRGIINGVGYLANTLFGVLDDRFAEKYEQDIQLIKQNEHHLAHLFQNQTSIIEAEYNMMKRMEEVMRVQHKSITHHLNILNNVAVKMRSEIEKITDVNYFVSLSLVANNLMVNLQNIQNMLIDTLTDTYHGKFNIHLITPTQLHQELGIILGQISKELTLPTNIQTDFQEIYQHFKIKAKLTKNYFIFEIRIPLVSRDSFSLYRMIPIPTQQSNNFINIIPISEYIAINLDKDVYIPISKMELQVCSLHHSAKHLCHLNGPVYQRKSDKDLCVKNKQTNLCETSIAECNNKFIELNELNNYLFIACNTCNLRILCESQITTQQLTGAGVIAIRPGCTIKSESLSIYSHKLYTSEFKITSDIYAPVVAAINDVINISIPAMPQFEASSDLLRANISSLGKRIDDIKTQNVITENVSFHDVHHYVLIYVILTLMASLALYLGYRRFCRNRNAITAPTISPIEAVYNVTASPPLPQASARQHRTTSPIFRTPTFVNQDEQ